MRERAPVVIKDGVAELTREELLRYAKDVYRSGKSPETRGVGLAVLTLERFLIEADVRASAAEAKLVAERDHCAKHAAVEAALDRKLDAAESREKALREVADDARELFEIIAKGAGNNAGHRARALAWLDRYHRTLAAGKETE